jgi:hypothetical protein
MLFKLYLIASNGGNMRSNAFAAERVETWLSCISIIEKI